MSALCCLSTSLWVTQHTLDVFHLGHSSSTGLRTPWCPPPSVSWSLPLTPGSATTCGLYNYRCEGYTTKLLYLRVCLSWSRQI